MGIKFTTTNQAAHLSGVKCLVYGGAGVGKTVLSSTAPNPFLISAESGVLSLRGFTMPMAEVTTVEGLTELHDWCLRSHEAKQFETICIDSISEIGEVVLNNAKKQVKDPRQAYGELIEKMESVIRAFRDLPGKNVYMSAKMEPMKDELTGVVKFGPAMPGAKLAAKLPYFFDEVFRMGVNKTQTGETYRFLQTQPDLQFESKDRSGALDPIEQPSLSFIFDKIKRTIKT
jgi:AAA domain